MTEVERKIRTIRESMERHDLAAVRLRGVDWFSWATAGGSSVIILTAEVGVAEVFVTPGGAWVLTNRIEAERFQRDVVPPPFEVWQCAWQRPGETEAFVLDHARGGRVASDRPGRGEQPLPAELVAAKRCLVPEEVERYRKLGHDAATAMTETLQAARPDWTEWELAAEGARAMWRRGIHPTLTLVAGETTVDRYRHPFPGPAKLGSKAMLVFCARREGLFANLTRFVYFRAPTAREEKLGQEVALVEAAAWQASRPGSRLNDAYVSIVAAYERLGHAEEPFKHHQGGTTGYLAREVVATPDTDTEIDEMTALAWNPSLPGAKIEDTVLTSAEGIEILTADPAWPVFAVDGRKRPAFLVRP